MGEMNVLIDVTKNISSYDEEMTIYARKPWTLSSEVVVAFESENGEPPENIKQLGLEYFLEVFLAKDLIETLRSSNKSVQGPNEICQRVIDYAINDA
ncbi:hypothetical protein [Citrobacter freundii]|uniref:hypothetical protein n=1 Tax=Citrobacter freundii TaxID=546 RepID=UPI0009C0544B|nr:hypothetical protein [Citrobacter freundii]